MRNSKPLPNALKTIYFSPEKPFSPLTTKLHAMLISMHSSLTNSPKKTALSLIITNDTFSSTRAAVLNANLPSTIEYKQTATISIKNNLSGKIIAMRDFQASQSVILNANQIYMPTNDFEIQNTLNQEIVMNVYYWMTTTTFKNLLRHAAQH